MQTRRNISGAALHRIIASTFQETPDYRQRYSSRSLGLKDVLMSGFAVFALKYPSLLQFDKQRSKDKGKLKALFGIDNAPSDTQMREIIDQVDPEQTRPAFKRIFFELQRGKVLEDFSFWKNHYLIAVDGTRYFSSESVHCEDCLTQNNKSGKIVYHHNMLGACLVTQIKI